MATTFRTGAELSNIQSWDDTSVTLIVPAVTSTPTHSENLRAKAAWYRRPLPPETFHFNVISDPYTKYTYVIRGGQSFYVSDKDDLLACTVGFGNFSWAGSYFKAPTEPNGAEAILAQFSIALGDTSPIKSDYSVSLRNGVPVEFFLADSQLTPKLGIPTVKQVAVSDGVVQLSLLSPGGRYEGTFWIDLRGRRLLRSVIDGTEVFNVK